MDILHPIVGCATTLGIIGTILSPIYQYATRGSVDFFSYQTLSFAAVGAVVGGILGAHSWKTEIPERIERIEVLQNRLNGKTAKTPDYLALDPVEMD